MACLGNDVASCRNLMHKANCSGDPRYKPIFIIGQRKKANRTPQIIIKNQRISDCKMLDI